LHFSSLHHGKLQRIQRSKAVCDAVLLQQLNSLSLLVPPERTEP
jgi:hypothetical protein